MRQIKGSNVCVVGGAGFLGSHLVNYLVEEKKCRVLVLDNLLTGFRSYIHPEATFVWYDVRDDERELAQILSKHSIQFLFNYAAEPYIPECFERPMHFFDINAVAVLRVLNAVALAGVEAVLQVSSAEIYGSMTGQIKESDPIEPHSTYGVSKAAADGLVRVRWREANVPAIALRQFNCIGERETHEYVVPEIISQLARGPNIQLGNNSARDFLYAGDAVRMAVELLEWCWVWSHFGEVYNLGSETTIQIYPLALLIGAVMGVSPVQITEDAARMRPWEIWHLQSDNSKIYKHITQRPQVSLEEALRRTVEYFRANGERWNW